MLHNHHIVPVHAGGSDDPDNLIALTVAEHAEAHKQLWLMNRDWRDEIAWLTLSGQIGQDEVRREINRRIMNDRRGKKQKPETVEKRRLKMIGNKPSAETRKKNSISHTGMKYSEETNAKKRAYRHTDEARLNISKNHHFAVHGRPGHGDVIREYYNKHPEMSVAGKTWKKDPITGKRVWMDRAQAK